MVEKGNTIFRMGGDEMLDFCWKGSLISAQLAGKHDPVKKKNITLIYIGDVTVLIQLKIIFLVMTSCSGTTCTISFKGDSIDAVTLSKCHQ